MHNPSVWVSTSHGQVNDTHACGHQDHARWNLFTSCLYTYWTLDRQALSPLPACLPPHQIACFALSASTRPDAGSSTPIRAVRRSTSRTSGRFWCKGRGRSWPSESVVWVSRTMSLWLTPHHSSVCDTSDNYCTHINISVTLQWGSSFDRNNIFAMKI